MPTYLKNARGTNTALLTTGLNSLANNSLAISSVITLSTGEPGYRLGALECVFTFGTLPTANTSLLVWFLREIDGTNYEDGGTSLTPARIPDAIIPVRVVTTAQRVIVQCELPPGDFKALLKNDGTGQAMASSGNTLSVRPITESW